MNPNDSTNNLREQLHSLFIQAVIEEQSLDKSDVMVWPREQQRIYQKYADKSMRLFTAYAHTQTFQKEQDLLTEWEHNLKRLMSEAEKTGSPTSRLSFDIRTVQNRISRLTKLKKEGDE